MANVKATDLIDFTRASKGHALAKISYGSELVTNGDFETDSDWTKEASWTISGGTATYDGAVHVETLFQNISLTTGKIIKISYTVKNVEAGKTAYFNVVGSPNASPLYKQYTNHTEGDYEIIATVEEGNIGLGFFALNSGTGGAFDLDNISVKEVLFNQPDGTLRLFEHPNNIPRIEYDAEGNLLGLLTEESRTNLFRYSEDFSNWDSYSANHFTINYATAPDGTQTATRFNPQFQTDPGNSSKLLRLYRGVNSTAGNVVSFSVFVKPVQSSSLYIGNPDGADVDNDLLIHLNADQSSGKSAWNLKTKTWDLEDSDHTTFQEEYPNGWYRIGIIYTVANNDSTNNHFINFGNRTSQANFDPYPSGLEDAYIWGAQVEVGSFATGVERSADVAEIDVDQFGYNQNEGTVTVEIDSLTDTLVGNPMAYQLNDGTTSERLTVFGSGSSWRFVVTDGGVQQSSILGGTFGTAKIASSFEQNKFNHCVNGTLSTEDTSGTMPTITELGLGHQNGSNLLNGHIKSLTYTPKRLSNAKLQELTS